MPKIIPTTFTSYEFSAEELISAQILSEIQTQYYQTLRAQIAQQLLNLDSSSVADLPDFEIQRSYLKGQMDIYTHLLDVSAATEVEVSDSHQGDFILDTGGTQSDSQTNPSHNIFDHDYSKES